MGNVSNVTTRACLVLRRNAFNVSEVGTWVMAHAFNVTPSLCQSIMWESVLSSVAKDLITVYLSVMMEI